MYLLDHPYSQLLTVSEIANGFVKHNIDWKKKSNLLQNIIHALMLQLQLLCQFLPRYLLCKLDKIVSVFQCQSWCSVQRVSSYSSFLPPKFSNFRFQLSYSSWINTLLWWSDAVQLMHWLFDLLYWEFRLRPFLNIWYHK